MVYATIVRSLVWCYCFSSSFSNSEAALNQAKTHCHDYDPLVVFNIENCYTGQQIQQDPNEPGKWQVVSMSASSNNGSAASTPQPAECEAAKLRPASPSAGKRLMKRVACTCPNCDQGEK